MLCITSYNFKTIGLYTVKLKKIPIFWSVNSVLIHLMMKQVVIALLTALLFCTSVQVYSQSVRVLFTQSVDNSVSSITDAVTAGNIEDTICAYINMADVSLDIAVWDNGSTAIISALNAAHSRGVVVRYISSTNSMNTALSGLSSGIAFLERQSGLTTDVMHNKFVIVDNNVVLSGSMNYGAGSMFDDYNNFVIIYDASLAQNYSVEFNEMWGGSGAQPNLSNSKFGPDKTDNTVHSFTIGGSNVESYFSPTDGTTAQIINAINSADHTLDFATFAFTNNDLGDAVIAAKDRGVVVRGIIENVNYFGSEYAGLLSNGIDVLSHSGVPYDFHHKYCIVDANFSASNPTVVTGSHNWSNSAEDEYDENTLIIHSQVVANQYWEEFSKRYSELNPTGLAEVASNEWFKVYPNPAENILAIKSEVGFRNADIRVVDYTGRIIKAGEDISGLNFVTSMADAPAGIYFVIVEQEGAVSGIKFIKK